MKKFKVLFISLALSTCIFGSSCSFVNAMTKNPNNTAEIKADYTEMTAENQVSVMSFFEENVSENTLWGNIQAETWKNAASLTFDVNYDFRYGQEYVTLKTDGGLQATLSKATAEAENAVDGLNAKALGNINFKYSSYLQNSDVKEYEKTQIGLDANLYIDNDVTYGDYKISQLLDGESTSESNAMKIGTQDFLNVILSIFSSNDDTDEPSVTSADTPSDTENDIMQEDFTSFFDSLSEYGIKTYYALSEDKGLVLKMSATQETVDKIMEMLDLSIDLNFVVTPTCDLYLVIDNTGKFKKISLNLNAAFTHKIEDKTATTSLKALLILETNETLTVTLPSGLAENELYKDFITETIPLDNIRFA